MKRLPSYLLLSCGSLLLVVAAWPHLFFKGQVPVDGNVLRLLYPNQIFLQHFPPTLLHWPLWNPYRNMGEPFLADPVSMAAYPPVWLLCRLRNILVFFRFWVLGHTLLAGFFMGLWIYRRTKDVPASLGAAAIAMFNGFFMSRVTLAHHFASASYVPVILYFFDTGKTVPFAVSLALQWLAGFPSFSFITGLVLLVCTFLSKPPKWRFFWQGSALALCLAAYQVIPFLEMLFHSIRHVILNPAMAMDFSEPWRQLCKMLFIPQWYAWHPQLVGDQAVVSFYVGPFVLLAAGWAGCQGSRREKLILAAVIACVVFSLGGYLPGYAHLAFLRVFRYPANWLLVAGAGLAFLAGIGVSRLPSLGVRWAAAGFILLDLLAFAQYVRVPWFAPNYLTEAPPLVNNARLSPYPGRIYHPPLVTANLEAHGLHTPAEFTFLKKSLPPSYGMAFGLREVSSYQNLTLMRAAQFQKRLAAEGPASPLLLWADVSTIITRKSGAEVWGPENIQIVPLGRSGTPLFYADEADAGHIEDFRREPEKITARINGKRAGTLVFSEVAFPGWTAWVDGHQWPPGVFENAFLSVPVPAGRHDVEFRFMSVTFWVGFWISAATALAVLLRVLLRHRL